MPQLKYFDSFLMGFLAPTLVHVQATLNTAARMVLIETYARSFLSSPQTLSASSHLTQGKIKGLVIP